EQPRIHAGPRRRARGAGGRPAQVQHHLPDLGQRPARDHRVRGTAPRGGGVRDRRAPRARPVERARRPTRRGARVAAALRAARRGARVHRHPLGHLGLRAGAAARGL
ncbi:MAG: hypothetical protein AVDCRST_MAG40-2958, partial [uncultured Gemmatimonadaceae bacterium]